MINDCLLRKQRALPTYRKRPQIFDFEPSAAYNAALCSIPNRTNPKRERMAGHSQFKNIMHRKGRQDAQKSKLFSKLAREITVAAKMGQPDPGMNARLRAAIISARQENMSKDSIETFRDVGKVLEAKFGEPRKAALTWRPHNTVPVDDDTGEKLLKLIDLLNEHDDVQNVYANFEVSDALVAKMGG